MESGASHRQPKRSKPVNNSQFSSISMQHSIPFLPPELVTEILSRLPVKSLLRFGCASKSWFALISSPEFVKFHLSLNANNKEYAHHKVMMSATRTNYSFKVCSLSSVFSDSVTEAKDLDYPIESYRKVSYGVSIAGSANGLICLVIQNKELILWNPAIRKYKKLPDPTTVLRYVHWRVYGFGYDEFHDDYKIVVIFHGLIITNGSHELEAKTYSLKSDSWRRIDDCPHMARIYVSGKFLNGKLHWAATNNGRERFRIPNIISIDLADEKWGEMEQPCHQLGIINLRLGVLGSDLSVSCNCNHTHVDVWVMKEYGVKESWTKMFTIKYPEERLGDGNLRRICLHITNEGEILVRFGSTFMIYNPEGDSLRYSKAINFHSWGEQKIYVESLVCPFSSEETEDATKKGLK